MKQRVLSLLRNPNDAHDVVYGDESSPDTIRGIIIDLDDNGYVVVQDENGGWRYIPKGRIHEISEVATTRD